MKTRLQNQTVDNRIYRNGFDCVKKVISKEGYRGLYRGLLPNLIGVTPEKAIKLSVNDYFRHFFSQAIGVPESHLPLQYGALSGALAGFCQVLATNPMEIVKIKMQISGISQHMENQNSLMAVYSNLGLRGLYYGVSATLCRDIPFSIIFFTTFALLKNKFTRKDLFEPSLFNVFLSGIMAGSFAGFVVTPMDGNIF